MVLSHQEGVGSGVDFLKGPEVGFQNLEETLNPQLHFLYHAVPKTILYSRPQKAEFLLLKKKNQKKQKKNKQKKLLKKISIFL